MGLHHRQIGEVAEQTGLSLRTIRYYEEVGLVTPSARSAGGFRLYSETDVARLRLIRRMKPLDFSLEEMKDVLQRPRRAGGRGPGRRRAPRTGEPAGDVPRMRPTPGWARCASSWRSRRVSPPTCDARSADRRRGRRARTRDSHCQHRNHDRRGARRPRGRTPPHLRGHQPPRRRQVDADRGARPARRGDLRGGRRARQGRPQGHRLGLDGDGASARDLDHLGGAPVRLRRRT